MLAAPPSTACLLGLAASSRIQPIGGSCALYVDLAASIFLAAATSSLGVASVQCPMPRDPALTGLTFHAQGCVADPTGPVLGLTLTAGRTLVVGD